MNFAVNKIKFNKQIIRFLGKDGKKKQAINHNQIKNNQINYNKCAVRHYSHRPLNHEPDHQWKFIVALISFGLYNQYKFNKK